MRETDYEYCFTAKQGEFDTRAVRCMRTKIIRAGDSLEIESYPVLKLNRRQQRAAKRSKTRAMQHAINRRNRRNRVRRLIEANFTEADFIVHGTYDYGIYARGFEDMAAIDKRYELLGLPWDYGDALRDVQNYLRRVKGRQRRRDTSAAVKYIYSIERTRPQAEGLPSRFHFHMVLHAPSLTREELEDMWRQSESRGYCNVDRLNLSQDGAQAIANYITKQTGARVNTSKNLKQPRICVSDKRLSPARAARVARDVMGDGKRIFERLYKGYVCTQPGGPEVRFSDFLPGAYIYARLRRRSAERGRIETLAGRIRTAL